jgi:hypothetical protein
MLVADDWNNKQKGTLELRKVGHPRHPSRAVFGLNLWMPGAKISHQIVISATIGWKERRSHNGARWLLLMRQQAGWKQSWSILHSFALQSVVKCCTEIQSGHWTCQRVISHWSKGIKRRKLGDSIFVWRFSRESQIQKSSTKLHYRPCFGGDLLVRITQKQRFQSGWQSPAFAQRNQQGARS